MIVQYLFKVRPAALNLLFIAYLWFVHPGFMARINASQDGRGDWKLGWLLLLAPLLEIAGIILKRPVSVYFARHYPNTGASTSLMVAFLFSAIFRLAMGVFVVMVAFQVGFGGPTGDMPGGLQWLMVVMVFVAIFKETFVILLAYPAETKAYQDLAFPPGQEQFKRVLTSIFTSHPPEQITLWVFLRDLLGDLLLLAFSAVIYSALWEFVTQGARIDAGYEGLMDYLGLTFFFLLTYLPLRIVSLMSEMAIQTSKSQRVVSLVSLAAVWVSAMLNIR